MLQAILFDLGDTLLDFEPMDTRAVFRHAARLTYDDLAARGHEIPEFERYTRGYYRAVKWAYLWAKLSRREFNSLDLLRKFHGKHGLPQDDELLRDLAWLWYQPVVQHTSVEEDLRPALEAMRSAGLRLGLISNTFVPGFIHDQIGRAHV